MTDLEKRMDRYDAVIHEYLRSNRRTVEYLCEKIGCDPSSLWRYRKQIGSFKRMPLDILANSLRMANVSNENLRYILGLPIGKSDEK